MFYRLRELANAQRKIKIKHYLVQDEIKLSHTLYWDGKNGVPGDMGRILMHEPLRIPMQRTDGRKQKVWLVQELLTECICEFFLRIASARSRKGYEEYLTIPILIEQRHHSFNKGSGLSCARACHDNEWLSSVLNDLQLVLTREWH
jgi:hypothetical protein